MTSKKRYQYIVCTWQHGTYKFSSEFKCEHDYILSRNKKKNREVVAIGKFDRLSKRFDLNYYRQH